MFFKLPNIGPGRLHVPPIVHSGGYKCSWLLLTLTFIFFWSRRLPWKWSSPSFSLTFLVQATCVLRLWWQTKAKLTILFTYFFFLSLIRVEKSAEVFHKQIMTSVSVPEVFRTIGLLSLYRCLTNVLEIRFYYFTQFLQFCHMLLTTYMLHKEVSSSCSSTAECTIHLFRALIVPRKSGFWKMLVAFLNKMSSCSKKIMICSVRWMAKFLKICFQIWVFLGMYKVPANFHNSISAAKNEL